MRVHCEYGPNLPSQAVPRRKSEARSENPQGLRAESTCQFNQCGGGGTCSWWAAELTPRANLDDTGHVQLGGFQTEAGIDPTEQQDGEDNGEVSH